MSKQMIDDIINQFQSAFPRPGIQSLKFTWCNLNEYKSDGWPNGINPGVYAFLDSEENLLYLGHVSSGRNLNTRLRAYFNLDKTTKNTKQGRKAQGICHVGLLGLPLDHGFEAPAIEEWLIDQLNPKRNTTGKKRARKIQRDAEKIASKQLIEKHQAEYNDLLRKFASQ